MWTRSPLRAANPRHTQKHPRCSYLALYLLTAGARLNKNVRLVFSSSEEHAVSLILEEVPAWLTSVHLNLSYKGWSFRGHLHWKVLNKTDTPCSYGRADYTSQHCRGEIRLCALLNIRCVPDQCFLSPIGIDSKGPSQLKHSPQDRATCSLWLQAASPPDHRDSLLQSLKVHRQCFACTFMKRNIC